MTVMNVRNANKLLLNDCFVCLFFSFFLSFFLSCFVKKAGPSFMFSLADGWQRMGNKTSDDSLLWGAMWSRTAKGA